MKKIALSISLLLFTAVAATAQTMNVRVGQVTYAHRAANTGDMTITGGNTLTIEGKAYNTGSISQISIDDSDVADNTVSVSYSGQTATVVVSGNIAHLVTVTVSGANVSITQSEALQQEVTYTLSGSSSNGSFFMDGDYKANFVLNNLSLTNPAGCPLDIQDGKAISVTLQGNNSLTDCANGTHNATLYINGHPTFSGTGSLTLIGLTKHAFTSDEYAVIAGGTINVTSAASDGFHINERFQMTAGTLNITSSGDGIDVGFRGANKGTKDQYERNGFAELQGGTITINTSGTATKGLKADSTIIVSGAAVDITTTGSATYDTTEKDFSSAAAVKTGGQFQMQSGSLNATSRGDGGKGINATDDILISGGKVVVTTTGDVFENTYGDTKPQAVKTDANITISGGEVYVASSPDKSTAFKADGLFRINGGTLLGIGSKKVSAASSSTQKSKTYSGVKVTAGQTVSYDGVSFTVPSFYSNSSANIIVSKAGM